ncbi:hypothetical protein CVT24_001231 [Panaeolus cyanescens]|uniref:Uncharacterized protein n=1 Tax=Panaeolus cyanescens TaxID=181874 RepID=A0A409YYX4_9AGAR|nr:hypothetical protein CVT24_001231 [Panaeolus cyanescens]
MSDLPPSSSTRLIYNSNHPKPLLPHTHRFVDSACEEAYMKCAEYERSCTGGDGDGDDETSQSLIRMLAYLISETIHEDAQRYISKQIHNYSKVEGGLLKLAHIYAEHVVGRFVLNEDISSLPTCEEAACDDDPDFATSEILQRIISQEYKCPLTNVTDVHYISRMREARIQRGEKIDVQSEGLAGHLRCVHIMPEFQQSDLSLVVDENPPNGPPLTLKELWRRYFLTDPMRFVYTERTRVYHSTANTIALESDTAALFNLMDIWLDRNTNPETYRTNWAFDVALDVARLTHRERHRYPVQVVFETMIIPGGIHLQIHACMARVLAWSGVKGYLERVKCEEEEERWRREAEEEMDERRARAGGYRG